VTGSLTAMTELLEANESPIPDMTDEVISVIQRAAEPLGSLADLPITEHVAVFEQIHSTLRGALNRPREQ
jgi:hypothetical protein